MLPVIVSRALHAQLSMNGQSSRLVEVSDGANPRHDSWCMGGAIVMLGAIPLPFIFVEVKRRKLVKVSVIGV